MPFLKDLRKKDGLYSPRWIEEEWTEISSSKNADFKNVTGGNTVIIGIDLGTTNSLAERTIQNMDLKLFQID